MARLSREFYSGNTVETAQNLLGKVLSDNGRVGFSPAASQRPRPILADATKPATPTITGGLHGRKLFFSLQAMPISI